MSSTLPHRSAVLSIAAALITLLALWQVASARAIPNSGPPQPPAPPLTGDLMEFLSMVPDTPEYRAWVSWGNPEAWAQATGIGPLRGPSDLDDLDDDARMQWMNGMTLQTQPPNALGVRFLAQDEMAPAYGFDFFAARQTLEAGAPPNLLTIVQAEAEPEGIAEALKAVGYEEQAMQGGVLYARGEDFATDMDAPATVARTGALNRIALLEPVEEGEASLAIARATEIVEESAAARFDEVDSLADNSNYRAIVDAIESAEPSEGSLAGLIFLDGPLTDLVTPAANPDPAVAAMLESYAEEPLSRYSTVAFATWRGEDFTELGVFLVLASGDDPSYVAGLLNDRMDEFVTVVDGEKLSERWETQWVGSYQGEENIAYVTVRLNEEDERPLNWAELIARRELLFLHTGE